MAVKGDAQCLSTLDAQVDPAIFNAGDGGLGNATQGGELGLTKPLQLADDAYRLTRGDIDALFGGVEFAHISVSDSHVGRRERLGRS